MGRNKNSRISSSGSTIQVSSRDERAAARKRIISEEIEPEEDAAAEMQPEENVAAKNNINKKKKRKKRKKSKSNASVEEEVSKNNSNYIYSSIGKNFLTFLSFIRDKKRGRYTPPIFIRIGIGLKWNIVILYVSCCSCCRLCFCCTLIRLIGIQLNIMVATTGSLNV